LLFSFHGFTIIYIVKFTAKQLLNLFYDIRVFPYFMTTCYPILFKGELMELIERDKFLSLSIDLFIPLVNKNDSIKKIDKIHSFLKQLYILLGRLGYLPIL